MLRATLHEYCVALQLCLIKPAGAQAQYAALITERDVLPSSPSSLPESMSRQAGLAGADRADRRLLPNIHLYEYVMAYSCAQSSSQAQYAAPQ